ncbi:MAG TPA: mechanosensitive ion channel domain-containing protein [Thermoplasmata archaeon]|nr:mechanosensitive ion channel domain-containing protein [Thermoplasmata archaeon]
MNRVVALTAQIALSCLAWVGDYYYPNLYLEKAFYTFLALAVIYFVFRIALEQAIVRTIKDAKTRYSIRKATSILYVLVFVLVLIRIWVEDSQALIVSYGLIGAGIAIALQDLFKNFVGGILIFSNGTYRVGDRVEIEGHYGDVIDIGLMFTTLLEMRGWVDGDQATGRLTVVPNGRVISGVINNYTKDHSFIWEEISIPVTYDSDWKDAISRFTKIVTEETRDVTLHAEKEMSGIMNRYYLSKRSVEPAIYVRLTDNWINLSIRYIALARERRVLQDSIFRKILQEVHDAENIKIASETIDITHLPERALRPEKL